MKIPSGLVSASTTRRNTAIWNQPLAVISELLRPQHGVGQINQQRYADGKHYHGLNIHSCSLLHPLTENHVANCGDEEPDCRHYENCALHNVLSNQFLHVSS